MLLLDYHNKIIEDTVLDKFAVKDGKYESTEAIIADFDGVTFHLFSDAEAKNILNISISIKCFSELKKNGVEELLKQQYGDILVAAEASYDATLQIDFSKPPSDIPAFARNVALFKRHCLAAPFYSVIASIEKNQPGNLVEIKYRDDEAFYLKPETDRLIVVFSINFKDPDDVVLSKVFLQEYQDARRTMSNAPSVTYSWKDPPLELKGVRNLKVGDGVGFVSFVLFSPHILGKKKESTVDNIIMFRTYLQYHMKCSKAFLHTRMRNRVRSFLQILNRAKSEPEGKVQKKTITGRTFTRADDPPSDTPGDDEQFNI